MVQFTKSAAAAVLAFCSAVQASPAAPLDTRQTEQAEITHPIGFDATAARRVPADAPVPKIAVVDAAEITGNVTEASPFTPSGAALEEVAKRFIVGVDNRHLWTDPNYPFHSVGKLQWSNGVFCSAALIGPRHILSAKHCNPDPPIPGSFYPGFDNGARFGSAQITNGLFTYGQEPFSPCETKGDWVVYALDQRLGDQLGYFGAKVPDRNMFDKPQFFHMGYPGDKDGGNRPYRQTDITVHSKRTFDCDSTGPFYTDTDTMGGQSGGPHWELDGNGNRWIWGALSISVTSSAETYAGWASGSSMIDGILKMRADFP
ncbi:hypothetical protein CFIO01_02036 [Colletotrichum fioriniae PJ7]|uniref:Peptidase S1 domain-containing protein n=1 Tax=Colletotrichum fioriniae PJ7 TaxID=1445577 RepID=A0A010RG56_9PEZI|nr:hypothetical protein CFIO01_02036 [Colletotrichum fioriniae PJ7]